jgi:hypothetical protein
MRTLETLADVQQNQMVKTTFVADLIAEHGETALVHVEREYTAFGTFVRRITLANQVTS